MSARHIHMFDIINHKFYEVNIFISFENISYIMSIYHIPFKCYFLLQKLVYKPHPYFGIKNVTPLPFISFMVILLIRIDSAYPDEVVDGDFDHLHRAGQVRHGVPIFGLFMEDDQLRYLETNTRLISIKLNLAL